MKEMVARVKVLKTVPIMRKKRDQTRYSNGISIKDQGIGEVHLQGLSSASYLLECRRTSMHHDKRYSKWCFILWYQGLISVPQATLVHDQLHSEICYGKMFGHFCFHYFHIFNLLMLLAKACCSYCDFDRSSTH